MSRGEKLKRLSGLVIVVNTFLPGVLILVLILIGSMYVAPLVREMRDAARDMQKAASDAKRAAEDVANQINKHATSAQRKVARIGRQITRTTTAIEREINKINIPLVPGPDMQKIRAGLNAAFAKILEPLSPVTGLAVDFQNIGAEIKKLEKMKDYFEEFAGNAELLYERLSGLIRLFTDFLVFVVIAVVIIVGWVVLSYLLWVSRRLAMGFALMRGQG
jgi:Sec-independent protein translocase protein TatA